MIDPGDDEDIEIEISKTPLGLHKLYHLSYYASKFCVLFVLFDVVTVEVK